MADVLNPFVYWGQNKDTIFLKVDLRDVTDISVDLDDEQLTFQATGLGVQGYRQYGLHTEFYLPIDPDRSSYRSIGRYVEFRIRKAGVGEVWPRLMTSQLKPAWLKIDFDRFAFEDDSDDLSSSGDENNAMLKNKEIAKQFQNQYDDAKNKAITDMKSLYLFVYNMFMWIGFCYVFISMQIRYYKYGEESKDDTFSAVGPQVMMCLLASFLEILHPIIGISNTNPMMAVMQVFGRNFIVFGLLMPESRLQDRHIVWWLFLVWSAVELVRYPYYILSILKMEWFVVTWLRYTVWIPLYPLGFMMEGLNKENSLTHLLDVISPEIENEIDLIKSSKYYDDEDFKVKLNSINNGICIGGFCWDTFYYYRDATLLNISHHYLHAIVAGFVMLLALPYYEQTAKWSVELPNVYNFSFDFPTFLRIYMLAFLPGMYILMKRMYEQRKKKIKPTKRPAKTSVKKKIT